MRAATRKAFRDAWQERTRSVFVLVTIAAGVAALLSLLGTYAVLTRELNSGYLATNPASAILHSDSVDERMIATALSNPQVGFAEARRIVFGRIKTGPAQWHTLLLFVIPNYRDMRLNKFVLEQGAWPPATGEVLIERDALHVAPVRIGDTITLRIGNGQVHTLRVSGRVHDVGLAQARMEQSVYGYITVDTLAAIGEKPVFDLLMIQVARDPFNPVHIRQVAADVKRRLEADGHEVSHIEFPTPGKHPHADLMAALLLAISSFGFFLLALSGVLTLNFTAALMAAQVRQIGVMKALGGTRLQVARIYLLQSLLLGLVATVLAVPLGIWGSRVLCTFMAAFLNFDITSFSIPAWVFAVAAGTGVVVPLVACAIPVSRSISMPVRRALSSVGTASESFGAGWSDRLLAGVGGVTRPVLLAIRNSIRRRMRFVLTCATLTCAAMLFMVALDVRSSMTRTFDRLFAAQRYDLTLYLEEMYPVTTIDRALRDVPGILTSENWSATEGWIAQQGKAGETDENHFSVIAMPPDSKLLIPVMAHGRGLQAGDTRAIVLNPTMAAHNPRMKVGDEVRLHIGSADATWRIAGICREPMLPPSIVYVSLSALGPSHSGMANVVQIALTNSKGTSLEQARAQIDPRLEREGIHVSGARSKVEFRGAVDAHVLMIYVFLVLASFIIGGVGGLGLVTTMSINILERRREIGILRAIGAAPNVIFAIVIGEAVTVAVIAWAAAVVLAWPLGAGLDAMIGRLLHGGFDFSLAPLGMVVCLAASVILGVLASLIAANAAARLTVREALSYE